MYIIACVIVPALWGLAAAWLFDLVEARRLQRIPRGTRSTPHEPAEEENAPVYYI